MGGWRLIYGLDLLRTVGSEGDLSTDQAAGAEELDRGAHFRHVLGHFATGVSLITGVGESAPTGLAVGSFMSVSLEPGMIAICPAVSSKSWPEIRTSGCFCVNILGDHQLELCQSFAVSGADKFSGLEWRAAPSGSPIIEGVVGWIDCEIENEQEVGDHYLVVGRVLELDADSVRDPLLFHRGDFGRLHPG